MSGCLWCLFGRMCSFSVKNRLYCRDWRFPINSDWLTVLKLLSIASVAALGTPIHFPPLQGHCQWTAVFIGDDSFRRLTGPGERLGSSLLWSFSPVGPDHLFGLVDMTSASRAADLRFDSRFLRWGFFSGSSHTSYFKISHLVATLPGAWSYRISDGTSWPSANIL